MSLEILTYPDERLRGACSEITDFGPELKGLAEEMVGVMYNNNGIGLAAPQVDRKVRLVVLDISGPEQRTELLQLVNPRIVEASGEQESEEGCLSVPNIRTYVTRAQKVTVQARDLEGAPLTIKAEGLLAVCLQHEMEHLAGVLIVDHMSRLKRSMYDKKVKKWMKQRN